MSSDWPIVKLSEIVNFKTGRLDSNQSEDGGAYPFFTCSPTTLAINTYAFDDEAVLLAGNNANGVFTVKYYKGKFNAYQRTYVITPKNATKVSVLWLYFRIKHVTTELQQLSIGSATKFLTMKILDAFEIALPPYVEQEKIADILWSLQNKLDNNWQINQTLESMAQVIFKSWFVDFEPVKAKIAAIEAGEDAEGVTGAAMCAISGKTNYELDQLKAEWPEHYTQLKTTAKLFPSVMQDSELGEVPEGWRIGTVADLCVSITNGGTPKRMENRYWKEGTIPWYKTGELFDEPLLDSEEHITEEGLKESSCHLWEPDTILIALYASPTVGRLGLLKTRGTANQACSGLVAKTEVGYPFLFFTLLSERENFNMVAVGSAQQNISQQIVKDQKIVIPPSDIASNFKKTLEPFFDHITSNIAESRDLTAIRDTLLPKLLSGELSIDAVDLEEEN